MTKKNFSNSRRSSNQCPFCNTVPAQADPSVIRISRILDPGDQIIFHLACNIGGVGIKLSLEQKRFFDKISSGEVLETLQLTDSEFNKLDRYIESLKVTGEHEKRKKVCRTNLIFKTIVYFDSHRPSEETIKSLQSHDRAEAEKKSFQNFETNGGSLRMAAAVA